MLRLHPQRDSCVKCKATRVFRRRTCVLCGSKEFGKLADDSPFGSPFVYALAFVLARAKGWSFALAWFYLLQRVELLRTVRSRDRAPFYPFSVKYYDDGMIEAIRISGVPEESWFW